MMRLIFTKEPEWLDKWDNFLIENPKGNHLILSDWLMSYKSYGFDYEVGIILDGEEIIGGFGAVIPKVLFFKFYIIPHGLVYKLGYEDNFEMHSYEIIKRAKNLKCCYIQLSVPISSNQKIDHLTYNPNDVLFLNDAFTKGKLFNYVYSSYGVNWVDFKGYSSPSELLEELTSKVRRNVRMPYNKNAKATVIKDINIIKKGYDVILENAKQANYSVRAFNEFRSPIKNLVDKELAYFISCEVDDDIKASGFFVKSGGYLTNIMGGVIRQKPDIKLGYMLQWEAIKKAFEMGSKGYNISIGGSGGVQDFKSKFGAEAIYYEEPHHHVILNSKYFYIFKLFDRHLRPYKSKISSILSKLKS